MKQKKSPKTLLIIVLLSLSFIPYISAGDEPEYLYQIEFNCDQGVYPQPNDGPFSVYVFCCGALGRNIGVIITQPCALPIKIKPDDSREDQDKRHIAKWDTSKRFWQDEIWAEDVTSFAWSPSFRYLYVATSAIYGKGGIFKLDLLKRTFTELPSKKYGAFSELAIKKGVFKTTIKEFNPDTEEMTLEVFFGESSDKPMIIENIRME